MFHPHTFLRSFVHGSWFFLGLSTAYGCRPTSDEGMACIRDQDCVELCSRVSECLSEEDAITIRLSWTVSGQTPSPSAPGICGSIDALELQFESDSPRDQPIVYYPVPCELGRIYYDRMPDRLTRLRIFTVDSSNTTLDVASRNIESSASDFLVDFSP